MGDIFGTAAVFLVTLKGQILHERVMVTLDAT